MTTSFVGSATAEANSITLPTHQAGDLIIVPALNASGANPTVPSGWFPIVANSSSVGVTRGCVVGVKVAASSSETSGTWTNATLISAFVYRHTTNYLLTGGYNQQNINTSTATLTGLVAAATTASQIKMFSSSWAMRGVWAAQNDRDIEQAFSGFTQRASIVGTSVGELVIHDSAANVSSVANATFTYNNTVNGGHFVMEILDTGIAKTSAASFRPVNIRGGADQ
jgi:hypothetical protein